MTTKVNTNYLLPQSELVQFSEGDLARLPQFHMGDVLPGMVPTQFVAGVPNLFAQPCLELWECFAGPQHIDKLTTIVGLLVDVGVLVDKVLAWSGLVASSSIHSTVSAHPPSPDSHDNPKNIPACSRAALVQVGVGRLSQRWSCTWGGGEAFRVSAAPR